MPHTHTATTTDQHIAALQALTTREAGATYLARVRGRDLADLARAARVTYLRTAADRREALIDRYIGYRLNSAAIRAL